MQTSRSLLFLWGTAVGCAPTIPGATDDKPGSEDTLYSSFELEALDSGAPPEASDPGGDPPEAPEDEGPPETEPEDDPEPNTRSLELRTGTYRYSFTLLNDPCDWKSFLDTLSDGVADVLPTDFAVQSGTGGFDMEAIRFGGNFGTEGPVFCAVEDDRFVCETQSVCPLDAFLCSYGWSYAVDFSGQLTTGATFNGTATVRFPTVDPDTEAILESLGLQPADCTQTLDLALVRDGPL